MEVLEISKIRLFDLMAERLFLDPIGYENELKYGYFWVGEGVIKAPAWSGTSFLDVQRAVYKPFIEKRPHKQAPLFDPLKRSWRNVLSIDF